MSINWGEVGAVVANPLTAIPIIAGSSALNNSGGGNDQSTVTPPTQPYNPPPLPPAIAPPGSYLDQYGNVVRGTNPAIPTAADIGKAPALDLSKMPTIPEMPGQTQQAISGETFNRLKPAIDQYESTTGRRISPTALRGLAQAEFQTAADRATQNKQLAMQQYGLELQKYGLVTNTELAKYNADLNKYGIDTNNLFHGADIALSQYNNDANRAIAAYGQQLQLYGMNQQEAFQWAQLSVNTQLANIQIKNQANAQAAQGAGAIGGIIGAGIAIGTGNPELATVGYGVGSAAGSGISGYFN